jgi:hypothetical protein
VYGLVSVAVAIGAILYCRHFWEDAPGVTLMCRGSTLYARRQGAPGMQCLPPIFALATIPLVPLPLVLQNFIWYALTLGGLGGRLVFSARLAQQLSDTAWTADERRWLYAIGRARKLDICLRVGCQPESRYGRGAAHPCWAGVPH